jgi:hypothetical protein
MSQRTTGGVGSTNDAPTSLHARNSGYLASDRDCITGTSKPRVLKSHSRGQKQPNRFSAKPIRAKFTYIRGRWRWNADTIRRH